MSILQYSGLDLLVVGSGKLRVRFPENVKVINSWLNHDEIINYILSAKVVVFPYSNASQSGLIEIAKSCRAVMVVTPVPTLLEQVTDGGKAVIARSFKPRHFAEAILFGLSGEYEDFEPNSSTPSLDYYILSEIERGK